MLPRPPHPRPPTAQAPLLTVAVEARQRAASTSVVLATGDGNDDNEHASFIRSVRACLAHGVSVELWAWRASCSKR